ncbi:hypothetical protein QAD02_013116 [Eretmocerus hayati]|uniref:Uncharacterized protein n=1 Tax=Eretmocerus hayati TaxID=131215 RepID=A0ACC2P469_9HYME|nr:hypothetical protein QAD02_013116 [Eretmocerus hayati]
MKSQLNTGEKNPSDLRSISARSNQPCSPVMLRPRTPPPMPKPPNRHPKDYNKLTRDLKARKENHQNKLPRDPRLQDSSLLIPTRNQFGRETEYHYSYVSSLETLKVMLNNPAIRDIYQNAAHDGRDVTGYHDISDGKIVKDNDFFNQRYTLRLAFFQDAFEVCNPLGSYKKSNKMIGLYLSLLNLPPYLCSELKNIKLVILCKEKYQEEFGWREILKPLLRDLKILETDGIDILCGNVTLTFKGSLVCFSGDNLGIHGIGGYVESFGKNKYVCRYCNMPSDEFLAYPSIIKPFRSVEEYRTDASEAQKTGEIVRGIKSNSPLNDLREFHVSKPGLPSYIDHDLFEGFVPYDLWLCIEYFVSNKIMHQDEFMWT